MKTQTEQGSQGHITGLVERITFHNPQTGYTVAKLAVGGRAEPVTAVGTFSSLIAGETVELDGEWVLHPNFGRQFRVQSYRSVEPASLNAMERYLSSGLIKGVGPVTARRLLARFGLETLQVIEEEPEKLAEIPGIGTRKAADIREAVLGQRQIRRLMLFLQEHGVSAGYALKIFERYGQKALEVVKENPYRLAEDVFGIGFRIADQIAQKLGLDPDSPYRLEAAITFGLREAAGEGHVYLPREELESRAGELIGSERDLSGAVETLLAAGRLVGEEALEGQAVYLPIYIRAEREVAADLLERLRERPVHPPALGRKGQDLTGDQQRAVAEALAHSVSLITGGPGTGKTTVVRLLIDLLQGRETVFLAAPTGRAARRLAEATGRPARTIHRLLEFGYQPGRGAVFGRNRQNPLESATVVLDEFSMVDLQLFQHLLAALGAGSRLVLVGDVDQLPSVGAGNLLRDLINSTVFPRVELREIFRQAQESQIIVNAHRVKEGRYPDVKGGGDFFLIEEEDPEKTEALVLQLCQERLPKFGPFDPMRDIQVLSPMRRGLAGVNNLNAELQNRLNPRRPGRPELEYRGTVFRLGDKVMQIRNNYQKEVFNGDPGRVIGIDPEEGKIRVSYPEPEGEREVDYERKELDELALAYALSVHKSQGSEYPAVVIPLLTQHYMLLQRNLLYTAITRARQLVVLVGSRRAITMAVRNNRVLERYSLLARRLREAP